MELDVRDLALRFRDLDDSYLLTMLPKFLPELELIRDGKVKSCESQGNR
jgi:hypothetical protein